MRTAVKKSIPSLIATLLMVGAAFAQPGPGMGGMGGMGPGGGWRASQGNTPGYALMSPQERSEHQNRMRAMQTYDECSAYVGEHRAAMLTRAQEKGVTLQTARNPCDMMRSRGQIR